MVSNKKKKERIGQPEKAAAGSAKEGAIVGPPEAHITKAATAIAIARSSRDMLQLGMDILAVGGENGQRYVQYQRCQW